LPSTTLTRFPIVGCATFCRHRGQISASSPSANRESTNNAPLFRTFLRRYFKAVRDKIVVSKKKILAPQWQLAIRPLISPLIVVFLRPLCLLFYAPAPSLDNF
jgi:hypothetical protein